MKKYITSVTINIEIDAENQEEAEAKFFDLEINFTNPLGEEADWTSDDWPNRVGVAISEYQPHGGKLRKGCDPLSARNTR